MSADTAIGTQGFGAGMSAVGAYYNASSSRYTAEGQKTALGASADVAEVNAKIADMSAQSALLTGQKEEQAVNLNTAKIKATQKTAFAANGVDLNSTSVNSVLTTTDVVGKVDANTVAANALRSAFGYQTQALSFRNQAIGARATAKGISPGFSPGMALTTSLVGSAGKVAGSWYSLNKAGAFDASKPDMGPQNDVFSRIFGQHNLASDALY